ncbi:MAG: SSS family solute:Na+ symporter, partial [Vicingaceae bacterium]
MTLALLDWIIIVAYLILAFGIGFLYKNQASKSLSDFFLGGRNLPWYIAGISMVATTFAADTPLWVTEVIAQHGVSGNWLWWNMLIGGMLTTFFFAKLWRRAEVVTELEFIELRYSGQPAAFLRGFKSVYMGIFLNAIVIGWVNVALASILKVFFDI